MPQDELNVVVEWDPVSVQIDTADPVLGVTLIADMGPPGPKGDQGDPGADSTVPGPQGIQGPKGDKGDKGDQGDPGADSTVPGPKGDQGDPGPAGADGSPGADGADGPPGVDGATWYSGSGIPSGGLGSVNDWYFRTTTGDVYLKTGISTWTLEINLVGPSGADGADGATGATGAAGTNGSTWYSGSGTPSSGTGVNGDFYFRTATGDVYTKSGGSWGSPIANLTGPKGDTGNTGPAGADGADGPPGADGSPGADGADGATWYSGTTVPSSGLGIVNDWYFRITTGDVYLKTGVSTWTLEINLVGPTGATGPAGADGFDGADGATGPAGADGVNGSTWYSGSGTPSSGTGVDGDYYFRTATGDVYLKSGGAWGSPIANLTGPTGATGATGPPGADGDSFVPDPSSEPDDKVLQTLSGAAVWGDAPAGGGDVAGDTHAAASKSTPVDADELPLVDSAASFVLKKLTWTNLKATLKSYFDTLYPSGSGTSTGTNTGDQTSVSGNAGTATKLATARNIDGQSFDGSANITVIAPGTHAASSKSTPVDADELSLVDSAASNVLKKLTWGNLKATLKTYFDTLYKATGNTLEVELFPNTPDSSGNAYPLLVSTANIRQIFAAFVKDVDGDWWGVLRIPKDYSSGGKIILRIMANDTNGTVSRFLVSTKVLDTGATWDAALTDETAVDTTMSTTAYRPSDVSFTLSTTPVAGKDLIFRIRHNGAHTNDTLAQDTILAQAVFQYVAV